MSTTTTVIPFPDHSPPPFDPSAPYFNTGNFHRKITTSSSETQRWFDRALLWFFAYDVEEGARAAEEAIKSDPLCPMAHWVLVVNLGTYYPVGWQVREPPALKKDREKISKALDSIQTHIERTAGVERALCEAVQSICSRDETNMDFTAWEKSYAEAMGKVYQSYANDLDVATIYAQSLMALTRRKLWNLQTGQPTPGSRAPEALSILERALSDAKSSTHPGINHMYIHLMEMSTSPEKASVAAQRVSMLVPDCSHLSHMPSHTAVLLGDYRAAVLSNTQALFNDDLHLATRGWSRLWTVSRTHNIGSLIYAAMLGGSFHWASRWLEWWDKYLTDGFVRKAPRFLDSTKSLKAHVWIRFGKWDEILSQDMPPDDEDFRVSIANYHYARGIAFAINSRIEEAELERKLLSTAVSKIPEDRLWWPNKAKDVIAVGQAMLDGELEYRKENFQSAFTHLRTAIERSDNLLFSEPWNWMQPVRHAYAALLLEQDHVEEACETYAADLGLNGNIARALQHPNNVWALHGYHECLVRLGKTSEAEEVRPKLELALEFADVEITSSCFCRLRTGSKREGERCCET